MFICVYTALLFKFNLFVGDFVTIARVMFVFSSLFLTLAYMKIPYLGKIVR